MLSYESCKADEHAEKECVKFKRVHRGNLPIIFFISVQYHYVCIFFPFFFFINLKNEEKVNKKK